MADKARIPQPGPIAKQIAFSILKSAASNKRINHQKEVINADLVPKFHERVIEKKIEKTSNVKTRIEDKKLILNKTQEIKQTLIKPIPKIQQNPVRTTTPQIPKQLPQRPIQPINLQQKSREYGKIDSLIRDPTLTIIECPGINKNLYVSQMGRRQITTISLTKEDILDILKKVSEKTKIPLIPGNFRAITEQFFISAIISDAELQFLIKKQSPYTLLKTL